MNNKGFALSTLEQYNEAIVWYDKALEVDPNYVTAQQNKRLSYNFKMAQYDPEMAQQINELSGDTPTNSMFEWSQLLILIPIGFGHYLVQRFSKKVKRKSQISR